MNKYMNHDWIYNGSWVIIIGLNSLAKIWRLPQKTTFWQSKKKWISFACHKKHAPSQRLLAHVLRAKRPWKPEGRKSFALQESPWKGKEDMHAQTIDQPGQETLTPWHKPLIPHMSLYLYDNMGCEWLLIPHHGCVQAIRCNDNMTVDMVPEQ